MEFLTHEIAERVLETCNGTAIRKCTQATSLDGRGACVDDARGRLTPNLTTLHDAPPPTAGTPFRFRLNWGAGGKRVEASPEFSVFVGDLAPEVTDVLLHEIFSEKFPSTLGAKVRRCRDVGRFGWAGD